VIAAINETPIPFEAEFDSSKTQLFLYNGPHHSSPSIYLAATAGCRICVEAQEILQRGSSIVKDTDSYTTVAHIKDSFLNRLKIEIRCWQRGNEFPMRRKEFPVESSCFLSNRKMVTIMMTTEILAAIQRFGSLATGSSIVQTITPYAERTKSWQSTSRSPYSIAYR
jgi:hypothetical protein